MARDRQRGREKLKDPGRSLSRAVSIFYISAFCLLFLRDFQWQALALAVAVPLAGAFTTGFLPRLFPVDKLLLSLTNFLCALGLLVLYDTNPTYAYHQSIYYFVGLAAMVVCIYLIRVGRSFRLLVWPMMLLSLVLLVLPLFIGKETYGAKNWFYVGGISVQPSEIVKLTLIIVISRFMADRRLIPWLGFSVACLGVLMLQADLGTALLYYGVALMLYFASSGNPVLMLCGIGGGVGAALLGYQKFAHVKKRVAIWLDPWSDYDNAGYQLIQSLMAIASGGVLGVGLGLGSPTTIPVYHTDFIFSVICEQFGMLFGSCVLLMYVAIIWRGTSIAMAARTRFHGLLAMGCTAMLGLQTFIIIGGVIKLIPLTGVTMPFVSYGGTSLVACLCLIGLIQGVSSVNEDDLARDADLADYGGGAACSGSGSNSSSLLSSSSRFLPCSAHTGCTLSPSTATAGSPTRRIRVYGRRSRTSCRAIFSTAAAWCWRPLPSARTAPSPAFISRMKLPAAPLCTCWAIPTGRLPTGLKVFKRRTSTASRPGFGSGFRRL